MELSNAPQIFYQKYEQEMTLEDYVGYLTSGFNLINENALDRSLELKEAKAIRMAFEFNRLRMKKDSQLMFR
jgi:hypothetical protein